MKQLADSVTPFSTWWPPGNKDLYDAVLPAASEGELVLNPLDRDVTRTLICIDRHGTLMWRGKTVSVAELDEIFAELPESKVSIRADKDVPFGLVGWTLVVARACGRKEVLVRVQKHANGFYMQDEAEALLAERKFEYWPELELAFPLSTDEGTYVRLVGTRVREGLWGPRNGLQTLVRMPTAIRYELDGRATSDLRELSRWMRDRPPRWIDADPTVPLKYVVAVQNEIKKAGYLPGALVVPDPPTEEIRNSSQLPYPAGDRIGGRRLSHATSASPSTNAKSPP